MMRRAGVIGAFATGLMLMAWGCVVETTPNPNPSTSTSGSGGTTSSSGVVSSSGSGGMSSVDGNCAMPYELMLGDTIYGHNGNGSDDLTGPCQAGGAPETVFKFDANATGTVTFTLTSDPDLGIYVRTTCDDPNSTIACRDIAFNGETVENLTLNVVANTTYFVVVDGYDDNGVGPFTLEVGATIDPEICDNQMDDNGNLLSDCEDPDCITLAACEASITAACGGALPLTPNMLVTGDTTSGTNTMAASCSGFGAPEVIYSYTPTQDQLMTTVFSSATDQGFYLRGACDDGASQLVCVDGVEGGTDERVDHVMLTAGTPITFVVDGYMSGEQGPYSFTFNTADFTEVEPNNDYMTANAFGGSYVGYLPSGDADFVAVTLAAPGNLTITAGDVFTGDCANSFIDTEVELFDTDGTTSLQFNDDIDVDAGNYCAAVTATGLPAGTYFVRVQASQEFCATCEMPYGLTVTN